MSVVVNFGGGTNSTALLVGMVEGGLRPHAIVFADTGSEMPHTHEHIKALDAWLVRTGFPPITVVRWLREGGAFIAVHEQAEREGKMPSAAYGLSGCTVKWKQQPADAFVRGLSIGSYDVIERWLGYDADEPDRWERAQRKAKPGPWTWRAPLIEWGWGRDECVEAIARAGLKQPGKSACFLCPNSKPHEIRRLARLHPALADRALAIEDAARAKRGEEARDKNDVAGLGRSFAWRNLLASPSLPGMDPWVPDIACGCFDGDEP